MRSLLICGLFTLCCCVLTGCGGESIAPSDPSQLPEFTEEQQKGMQSLESQIAEEERTGGS